MSYFNNFKVITLVALLLLVFAGVWLVGRDSGSTSFEVETVLPQPWQDSHIEQQAAESTAARDDTLNSEAPATVSAENDGPLVIMLRPDWALDDTLLAHADRLALSAKQGDSESAYILGMNLRNCYVVPQDAAELAERLQQAYRFNDDGRAVAHISERYDFCLGVGKSQRSQFYIYLAMAASSGYVPAQEAIALITPEQYMNAAGYAKLERNDYVAKRSGFIQQQVDFLSSAAQHGSIKALIKLSQMHHAQTVGLDGRLQAYAFNQIIMELTDDTELYNRYKWFQQKAQSVFTAEEIDQALAMSAQWLGIIQANGTLYPHDN